MSKKITIKEKSDWKDELLEWFGAFIKYVMIVLLTWLVAVVIVIVAIVPYINRKVLITITNTFFDKKIKGGLVKDEHNDTDRIQP